MSTESIAWSARGYDRFVSALHAINHDCGEDTSLLVPPPRRPDPNGGLPGVELAWHPPTPPARGTEPLRDVGGYRTNPRPTPAVQAPKPRTPWWKIWSPR